jgi:redox-sensing transcriptional repressor
MFKKINVIMRISKYKSVLTKFKALGFDKVFSDNLADAIGVSATQVRKDFSLFGVTGHRRGGYKVDDLLTALNKLLSKDKMHNVIIIGAGNIGNALLKYKNFVEHNIKIVGAFDSDEAKINRFAVIPVLPMDELESVVKENDVKIGIIATTDASAQDNSDLLISVGIRAILNFTRTNLKTPDNVQVNDIDLIQEIDTLIYFVNKEAD